MDQDLTGTVSTGEQGATIAPFRGYVEGEARIDELTALYDTDRAGFEAAFTDVDAYLLANWYVEKPAPRDRAEVLNYAMKQIASMSEAQHAPIDDLSETELALRLRAFDATWHEQLGDASETYRLGEPFLDEPQPWIGLASLDADESRVVRVTLDPVTDKIRYSTNAHPSVADPVDLATAARMLGRPAPDARGALDAASAGLREAQYGAAWQAQMSARADVAHSVGLADRNIIAEAQRRGHHAPLQERENKDIRRAYEITDRAVRADDLRSLPNDSLEIYRIAARWPDHSPALAAAIAGFDETVSRPERWVGLPTTSQVRDAHNRAADEARREPDSTMNRSTVDQDTGPVTTASTTLHRGPTVS